MATFDIVAQDEGWCAQVWKVTSVPSPSVEGHWIHLPHIVTACLQFLTMAGVAVIQFRATINHARSAYRHSQQGRRGVGSGQEREDLSGWVVLPTYATALWQFALADALRAVHTVLMEVGIESRWVRLVGGAVVWTTWHTFSDGLALSLCSPSAGQSASRRCFLLAFVVAASSGVALSVAAWNGRREWAMVGLYVFYVLFYGSMLLPKKWMWRGRRPAVRSYASFSFGLGCMRLCGTVVALWFARWQPSPAFSPNAAHSCGALFDWTSELLQSVGKPLVVYATLLADSRYWMGLLEASEEDEENTPSAQGTPHRRIAVAHIRQPLLGTNLEPETARDVALAEDRLRGHPHLLHILPSELRLHSTLESKKGESRAQKIRPLGSGGLACVYRGSWRNRAVAVKLLTRVELLPEDVRAFVRDAESLAQLACAENDSPDSYADHALEFCGVCIRPPALALVLPLCEHGSLRDLLDRFDTFVPPHETKRGSPRALNRSYSTELTSANHPVYVPPWQKPLLDVADSAFSECMRWKLALQCCRAVALLHMQRPALLHLDLKSENFLVAAATERQYRRLGIPFVIKLADLDCAQSEAELASLGESASLRLPQTVQWSAPEVIVRSSPRYAVRDAPPISTASDCYSLGVVLWEIGTVGFACSFPFGSNDADLGEAIYRLGQRPEIVPHIASEYADLIREMWHADPDKRPSARIAAQRLEQMILHRYGGSLLHTPNFSTPLRSSGSDSDSTPPSPSSPAELGRSF